VAAGQQAAAALADGNTVGLSAAEAADGLRGGKRCVEVG
jgi:hypothetical protein